MNENWLLLELIRKLSPRDFLDRRMAGQYPPLGQTLYQTPLGAAPTGVAITDFRGGAAPAPPPSPRLSRRSNAW